MFEWYDSDDYPDSCAWFWLFHNFSESCVLDTLALFTTSTSVCLHARSHSCMFACTCVLFARACVHCLLAHRHARSHVRAHARKHVRHVRPHVHAYVRCIVRLLGLSSHTGLGPSQIMIMKYHEVQLVLNSWFWIAILVLDVGWQAWNLASMVRSSWHSTASIATFVSRSENGRT